MRTLSELSQLLDLGPDEVAPAGPGSGKVSVAAVRSRAGRPRRGKLVLVTAMTPTRHGEGKTVTTIGLAEGLCRIGSPAVACLRQPSLGPVFGIKGGATGGGRATVEPATEINFGFTGDIHAVASAHDLLSAVADNHVYHGNALGIDPSKYLWSRTMDVEDRALRHLTVGQGISKQIAYPSSFMITAASEVMAVLALARDYPDLKARLNRILVGFSKDDRPIRASDLRVGGAMAALLRHALEPNLVQTTEGTPALVHAGPFGNLAHGTCSRLAIELALSTSEYAVVEAGFATELGAEKFVDIVTPVVGVDVDAAVLVVTQRGLRFQGGATDEEAGRPALAALERGLENLGQHLSNLDALGAPTTVALNRFPGDSAEEATKVLEFCKAKGVEAVESRGFAEGGAGVEDLARAVQRVAALGRHTRPLYPVGTPILRQVELIATRLYGADGVDEAPEATEGRARLERLGEAAGPVCMAKTPLSLSDDAKRLNLPRGYRVTVHRYARSAGAGFTVSYLGAIETMPGLPAHPASEEIDITPDGEITGSH
ncbi:MAG TPA: formate--tetrahydrofolate ligase [Thermoplasmata archaeon]|nr:formate--tetrahydrofolate ligase [Thermoplasmata archaeon]